MTGMVKARVVTRRAARAFLTGLFLLAGVLVVTLGGAGTASANAKYASYVIDMESGAVLHQSRATRELHPASLTKMMTLYMVFEAVRNGRLSMDQYLPVSARAAAQPPSRIGLKRGQMIRLDDAVEAAAVKSGNDVAVVLAEAVAGSEAEFARLMTKRARAMGMSRTTFRNASGLTKSGHKSTARDMAILARRLFLDFPEYYDIFSRQNFRHKGRNFRATNKLLGRYNGADGVKTGYTRAAGYNIAASAEQNGRRVLAVVFGGKSAKRRDRHVVSLLDQGFKALPPRRKNSHSGALIASAVPRPNPLRAGPVVAARPVTPDQGAMVARSLEAIRTVFGATSAHAAAPQPVDAAPRSRVRTQVRAPITVESWSVQLGAFRNKHKALDALRGALELGVPSIAMAPRAISENSVDGRPLYRARLTGFDETGARATCRDISARGLDCVAIPPGGWG